MELAISPENANLSDFLWRVSIAEVEADGPFSLFSGCDRIIMLVEGTGMTLEAGAFGSIALVEPLQAKSFSGDWPVIVRRDEMQGSLKAVVFATGCHVKCPAGATRICHLLNGNTDSARQGDTLITDRDLTLTAAGNQPVTAILAMVRGNVQSRKA
jgi:environmental stress-induced protein Ves